MKMLKNKKALAVLLAVCMLVPCFMMFSSMSASADTKVTPMPYALEELGQHHPRVYRYSSKPDFDGVMEEGEYTLVDTITPNDILTGDGTYTVTAGDNETPEKFIPAGKDFKIYASYDDTAIYFHIEGTVPSDKSMGFIRMWAGTNIFPSATSPMYNANAVTTWNLNATAPTINQANVQSGYNVPSANRVYSSDDYAGRAYSKQTTQSYGKDFVYEMCFDFQDIRNNHDLTEGGVDVSFDRLYVSILFGYGNSADRFYYAVPSSTAMVNGTNLNVDYGYNGTFVGNMFEFCGNAPQNYTDEPVLAKEAFNTKNSVFTLDYETEGNTLKASDIEEAGALFVETEKMARMNIKLGQTETVGGRTSTNKNTSGSITKITSTTEIEDGKLKFAVSKDLTGLNDTTLYTFRPYIKYTNGDVLYGDYYTTYPEKAKSKLPFDKTINVLLIGNDLSDGFLEELESIGFADNIGFVAANVSCGKLLGEDWTAAMDGSVKLEYNEVSPYGNTTSSLSFKEALAENKWDAIVVQQNFAPEYLSSNGKALSTVNPFAANFFNFLKENAQGSKLYWNETWSNDIGFAGVDDKASQDSQTEVIKNVSEFIANYNGITLVPTGTAWDIARNDSEYKITAGDFKLTADDNCTAGNKGGSFLNASVLYEVLACNSCVGNAYVPGEISQGTAKSAQLVAHNAVVEYYGDDYAKAVLRD